ncbi:TonB-dependent hemoglobin/transferrin/lactoferrin family receptor [Temperatibacter marinus]|uniref:TonB-dependent hemoglobin/transferrin/lactoferrin family receptor n=1 Tax=Temperatibacter marinus TaxID=1456591 RepID=A0AA52HAB5_9PROT|nr:TonB-dependent hemoglobin/transferrin/lactoferrin family receptor [Temperatibacter marinus]WND03789.1 TonB-dependent hemoglobin/transferrin/lactoferrin family receptor [Temperatibacter marinus]
MYNHHVKTVSSLALVAALSSPSTALETKDEPTVKELETIIVTATRRPKKLKDVAGSLSVMTAQDIEKEGATDLNELFKYDPSVQITGSVGGAQNIIVRGMGSDRILMIKDGMRMNEGYGADGANDIVGRGFIETDTLKQVEVAKGAGSSLYGSDALGGVVVFTTKDASDYVNGQGFGGQFRGGYSDYSNQWTGGATLAHVRGNVENLLSLTFREGQEQQNYEKSRSPFSIDSQSFLYKGRYRWNETESLSLTIDLWRQDQKGDRADGLLYYFRGLAAYGYAITDEQSTSDKKTNSFKFTYESTNETALYDSLNVALYRNSTQQSDEEYGELEINSFFTSETYREMWKTSLYDQETYGLLSSAVKKISDRQTLGYGIDIESTKSLRSVHEYREGDGAVTRDDSTQKFPENDVFRVGLFMNDEISFLDEKLLITPGVRFDHYKMDPSGALKTDGQPFSVISEENLSLNVGALYHVSETLSVFAQLGQGFKAPSYDLAYAEHYNQPSSTYIYQIIPSDNLDPETSNTFEIGLRGSAEGLSYSAAYYYNSYDNFLTTTLVDSVMNFDSTGTFASLHEFYRYENIDSVTIKGAEAGLNWRSESGVSLFANAAWQTGRDDTTGDYITSITPLSGTIGLSYDTEDFSGALTLRWADDMKKVNEGATRTDGYAVLDLAATYQLAEALALTGTVQNLFNKEYIHFSNVAGHASSDDLAYFAEPGRRMKLNLRFTF